MHSLPGGSNLGSTGKGAKILRTTLAPGQGWNHQQSQRKGLPWGDRPILAACRRGPGPAWLPAPSHSTLLPFLSDPPNRSCSPSFSPAQLSVPEGANATFTCSFSNSSEHFVLNWYRLSPSNQTDKLAAFPRESNLDPRFQVAQLPDGQSFQMSVLSVQRNDSGIYLCGAISLRPKAEIRESCRAELMVTERILEPPTVHPSPSPRPVGHLQGLVVGAMSVLVGIPVLLLLAWVLAAVCSRAVPEAEGARSKEQPREGPSAVPTVTMDYGVLDFQGREKAPECPAPCVHTEYATIVFPEGLGALSPGLRTSAGGLQALRPPRQQDGHCSWPL
ncbi:programmed cell death protein 1 isoform X2 [Heterocephalus glaber]|uniref:Programmed cell death protein 1 isoform X2 n=1 Tax=Heterocephalus glaber TaxID=10181 RepID=A0AAX6QA69_HETGA|nr:programmed cell death protein 1 isoform X2 [Heterocephalus glaber]